VRVAIFHRSERNSSPTIEATPAAIPKTTSTNVSDALKLLSVSKDHDRCQKGNEHDDCQPDQIIDFLHSRLSTTAIGERISTWSGNRTPAGAFNVSKDGALHPPTPPNALLPPNTGLVIPVTRPDHFPGCAKRPPPGTSQRSGLCYFMPERFDEQPWYQQWRETLDKVIAAQMQRDSTKPGTPERKLADEEYEVAFAAFRALANQVR
jgi:hypothetical protein